MINVFIYKYTFFIYFKGGEKFGQNKNGDFLLSIKFPVLTLKTTVIVF